MKINKVCAFPKNQSGFDFLVFFVLFFFWLCLCHEQAPGPGIEPTTQQEQRRILNH